MSTRRQILVSAALVLAAAAVVAGFALAGGNRAAVREAGHDHAAMQAGGGDTGSARPVRIDPVAARRIGVTFAAAVVRPVTREVVTVGTLTWDETRVSVVNAKVEGWVERIYVDFTGQTVRAGEPLLEVYSPMLITTQEELILAARMVEAATGAGERTRTNARALLEAARRRLRYQDIGADEIAAIERAGEPRRTLTLRAPTSGAVVEKNVTLGARLMPGMDLYRLADLSVVWVDAEVFEKDLGLVRVGQPAVIAFDAYPGERFEGRVTFVHPVVSMDARTGRVRVELPNPEGRLKPGMYARVALRATATAALVIPRDAVHVTGERALVFVRSGDDVLVPREVTTGAVVGDHVVVLAGLEAGDVVVASAHFLIDAESNLGAALEATLPGTDSAAAPSAHTAQ